MARYIKLDDAVATLHKYFPLSFDRQNAEDDLKPIPTADVEEVRHGEWETDFCDYVCSVCGGHISDCTLDDYSEPNYCPNCGAKMDGKEKNDAET